MAAQNNRSGKTPGKQNMHRDRAEKSTPSRNGSGALPGRREAAVEKRALQEEENREILLGESSGELVKSTLGEKKRRKKEKPRVRTVRAKTRSRLPMSSVFFMVVCTMLIMFTIINYVQINEYTQELAALKKEFTTLDGERTELELEVEKKNDISDIEEKARQLGMMGSGNLRKVVVHSQKEDTVEKYETEEEDYGIIATVMSALSQNIRTYWNIFGPGE